MPKNKKITNILGPIIAFALVPFLCMDVFALELTRQEKDLLSSRDKIVFVSQTSYPPFELTNKSGLRDGMMLDVVRWLSVEIGFKPVFVDMNFQEAQAAVLSGKADIITSLFHSEKRKELFAFTDTVFTMPVSIFIKAERTDIKELNDLSGKTIAIQSGDYAADFLREKKISYNKLPVKNFTEAVKMVIAGRADAVIGDEQVVYHHIFENRLTNLVKKVGAPLYIGENCMAGNRDAEVLVGIINRGIGEARKSGVIDKISIKWLGVGFSPPASFLTRYILPFSIALGTVLLIGLWVWVWNIRLRKMVRIKTAAIASSEKTLRESKARFRELADMLPLSVCEINSAMIVAYANRNALETFGYTPEDMKKGVHISEALLPDDFERAMKNVKEVTTGGHTEAHEYTMVRKNGNAFPCVTYASPIIRNGEPEGIRVVVIDETEQKHAEEERKITQKRLEQAERMEAIGTLSGGIAHDFNNLLMAIQGYASLVIRELPPSHPHYHWLKNIEELVQNGANLTGQLLGFARGGNYEVKTTHINEIIKKTASVFGQTKKEISIDYKCADSIFPVDVDRGQMEQVFLNLLVNAWQAMPGGGNILLETENILVDEKKAIEISTEPGNYVKISVTDTGVGIDERIKQHIFEPFFTTKKMGRGTGLGLATVYGIVKGHKGAINVDSEPRRGTTFSIYLPASNRQPLQEETSQKTEKLLGGAETILVVDDERMILETNCELLKSLGYRVFPAGSGQEALSVYMEKNSEIDLVILDMIMPGISGGETFDRLSRINSDVKVLLSSGYSINSEAKNIIERGCQGFIQKPFRFEELSRKVREILR
ncbi:MAG: ATP-binding protein [Syntrophales bacterium]